ncbi:adenosylcobyric acid synthase [Virgibacillus natechei]|uniref:Cobyric acid synthase n=1 Tax=Virgibacillus natechei TaxID=1216297 RepID=A0ABS4IJ13_9BACI|nr:cobyric acid synthase [Virgibacillus natechei]MBP1969969.1 adenosylcobyric acid synthase [Virgibacillus natechei]UZD13371.1 cobyric acid synthase [Virgibacillus natechei]
MKGMMIQGTASSVGKSILTTGLCRLFANKGYAIAPFKAQNMSGRSIVTRDGKEMSISQAQQAEAAGLPPSVLMNPVLLKPRENLQTEVMLLGEKRSIIPGQDYKQSYYDVAKQAIQGALNQLEQSYDFMLIEGAGSPVEMNLKDRDLANMAVAEMADVPVILVADIDRGGAFASIVGTLELLTTDERQRVKGLIINKFHGVVSSFASGREWLEDRTGISVLGVVPHTGHNLAEEDSVEGRGTTEARSTTDKPPDYDKLAEHLEAYIDWKKLLNIMTGENDVR